MNEQEKETRHVHMQGMDMPHMVTRPAFKVWNAQEEVEALKARLAVLEAIPSIAQYLAKK